ncbi:MAG: hypothetical protein ACREVL_01145 [Solimonas sp.]
MTKAAKLNLEILRGRTFSKVLRWGQPRLAYREIAAATRAAPCILTTAAPHGLPDGWTFTVSNAKGMSELNSQQDCGGPTRQYQATVIDTTTVEINDLNAAGYPAYTGGGVMTYHVPVDLDGYEAELQVRPFVESQDVLLSLSTTDGGIVLDNDLKTITLQLGAVDSAALDWEEGVYDLELRSAGGVVLPVAYGSVKVCPEVTR